MIAETYTYDVVVEISGLSEEDWLEYRRQGIGGSDAAAILGISPFATARELYYDKLKIVSYEDEESNWVAKRIRQLLEDLVAEIFHKKRDILFTRYTRCSVIPSTALCLQTLTTS